MAGKLPIDRVRENEDAPHVYDDHKQRFAVQQARLRGQEHQPDESPPSDREAVSQEADDA